MLMEFLGVKARLICGTFLSHMFFSVACWAGKGTRVLSLKRRVQPLNAAEIRSAVLMRCISSTEDEFLTSRLCYLCDALFECERSGLCHSMALADYIGFTILFIPLPASDDDNHFPIKVPTHGSDPTPIDDGTYFLNGHVILVDK